MKNEKLAACEYYFNKKCKSLECWHSELHIKSEYCNNPCSINKTFKNAKCIYSGEKK